MKKSPSPDSIIAQTRCWIERMVIALNLCPFARKPYEGELVRYVVSEAREPAQLLRELQAELDYLQNNDPKLIETTLLIHPWVLNDFLDYNDFLDEVDRLLEQGGYADDFQIASLHPDYQFAGTHPEDAENYTNRSPYPLLHLLRTDGVARAIAAYARPERIPERNIAQMERLGAEQAQRILRECMEQAE
jgi:hypothetical protein